MALPAAAQTSPWYGVLPSGHVDQWFCYLSGTWETRLNREEGLLPSDSIALAAYDALYPAGSRVLRPAGTQWGFTGVSAGQPLYHFPPTSWGGVWPGFSTCSGSFASYANGDTRLGGATARWVGIHLKNVRYIGETSDPDADGLDNLAAYAHGLHPRLPDSGKITDGTTPGLPFLTRSITGAPELLFRRRRATAAPQIGMEVLTTASLAPGDWSAVPLTGPTITPPVDAAWESARVPLPAAGRAFVTPCAPRCCPFRLTEPFPGFPPGIPKPNHNTTT